MKRTSKHRLMRAWYKTLGTYKGKYLDIVLSGGLCNKLFCLSSALDIVLKEGGCLIEPYFGWKKPILFSDIYDLDNFNSKMSIFNNSTPLMIARDAETGSKSVASKTIAHHINLWKYSEKSLATERSTHKISKNSTMLKLLGALKVRSEYETIVQSHVSSKPFTAIQMRIESDWVKYAETQTVFNGESVLVPLNQLISMVKNFCKDERLFFTSGEHHSTIGDSLKKEGFRPDYFYNPDLEYEINAAINFEICCQADTCIGLSRSTFSNLIALKRAALLNNDNTYIYNYNNTITRRIDKGLQPQAIRCISEETVIS